MSNILVILLIALVDIIASHSRREFDFFNFTDCGILVQNIDIYFEMLLYLKKNNWIKNIYKLSAASSGLIYP